MVATTRTFVIVDDEQRLADLFSLWLADLGKVSTAYSGEDALAIIDDSVDMVFLDRQMPELTGDEVLARLRDRGYTGQVAMITAVDPDFDILDMAFDTYLTKPVSKEELQQTVDQLERRIEYNDHLREYFATATKLALLETHKPARELAESAEYQRTQDRLNDLQETLQTLTETFTAKDYAAVLAQL